MYLQINGKDYDDMPDDLTVEQLLVSLKLNPKKVAVERNLEVVPKSTYAETALNTGDRIEIINFIGGG